MQMRSPRPPGRFAIMIAAAPTARLKFGIHGLLGTLVLAVESGTSSRRSPPSRQTVKHVLRQPRQAGPETGHWARGVCLGSVDG